MHAARTAGHDTDIAVIVDAARPAEVTAMLVDAYALTPRQREVLGLLLRGGSMTQIARQLRIPEHTANDHRKAIYARMHVASRGELAAAPRRGSRSAVARRRPRRRHGPHAT